MNRRALLAAVIVFLCGAVTLVVLSAVRNSERSTSIKPAPASSSAPTPPLPVTLAEFGPSRLGELVASAVRGSDARAPWEPGSARMQSLAEVVGTDLSIYCGDSLDAVRERDRALGATRPPSHLDEAAPVWNASRKTFSGASFDPERTTVRARYLAGKKQQVEPFMRVTSADAPHRFAGADAIKNNKLDIVEVLIPSQLSDLEGKMFTGRLDLCYAWDSKGNRWLLRTINIYDDSRAAGAVIVPPV